MIHNNGNAIVGVLAVEGTIAAVDDRVPEVQGDNSKKFLRLYIRGVCGTAYREERECSENIIKTAS